MTDNKDHDVVLTHREMQVLDLVACGYSAKEIALRVDIAPRTVERHIENARLKMSARNRAHMVTRGLILGLITPIMPKLPRARPRKRVLFATIGALPGPTRIAQRA